MRMPRVQIIANVLHVALTAAPTRGYCTRPGECLCYEGYTGTLCEMTTTSSGIVTQSNSTDSTQSNSGVNTEPRPPMTVTTVPSGLPTLITDIRMQGEWGKMFQGSHHHSVAAWASAAYLSLYHRRCTTQCLLLWQSGRSCSGHITRSDSSWNSRGSCSYSALEKGPLGNTSVKYNTMQENIR